jgi:phage replication initiation protein
LRINPLSTPGTKNQLSAVPQRRGWGGSCAFVDWVNCTCHESSFFWENQPVTDDQVISEISKQCLDIFGFGITSKRDKGLNFYRESYVLGNGWGFVCFGGQRNTALVQLSGSGCAAAKNGWEKRLQSFLEKQAVDGRITRVDLAYDDYKGNQFNCEALEHAYDQGLFKMAMGGRNPDIELRGNWKNPNGKGRTIYVGNRANGKFFRGYEKGRQLGDASSNWFRVECEFKSVDRIIPYDVLTKSGEYLAAAYPVLSSIDEHQERILTKKKTVEASYVRMTTWLHKQCGAALNLMLNVEQDATKVLAMLVREGKIPRGLEVPDYKQSGHFIHEWVREALPFEAQLSAPF